MWITAHIIIIRKISSQYFPAKKYAFLAFFGFTYFQFNFIAATSKNLSFLSAVSNQD